MLIDILSKGGIIRCDKNKGGITMGNMVMIAVRHNAVKDVSEHRYKQLDRMINDYETVCPKFFDGRQALRSKECYADDIIMSCYYHASDRVNLLISNTMAAYLPSLISPEVFESSDDAKIKRRVLSSIKQSMKWDKFPEIQTRAINQSKLKTVDDGDDIALFGVLTDSLHKVKEGIAIEALYDTISELPWLENGEPVSANQYSSRFEGLASTPFLGIGSIKSSQLAMVLLSGNVFHVRAMPNHGINYNQIDDLISKADPTLGRVPNINFYPSILEGLGYQVKEKEPEMAKS